MISIVLPSHNEEANVSVIYHEINTHLKSQFESYEIIFVDDGSTDSTVKKVRELQSYYSNVRLIQLTRNFGHQAALMAGLSSAKGDAVIVMDSDLQHPPSYLPKMIFAWKAGNFIVQMVRKKTEGVSWHKRLLSNFFYKFINLLSPTPIRPGVADFQLLDKAVVHQVLQLKDHKPFLRGMVEWFGFKSTTIEYIAEKRVFGTPSYTFRRSLKLGGRALILVSRHPLRLGLYIGLLSALICSAYIIFTLIAFILGIAIPGWTSLVLSSLFPATVQLIILGILGEYIGYIFDHSRNLPAFVAYPESIKKCEIASETPNRINHSNTMDIH